ncbi:hypothetical protein GMRT_10312 [Giardia muris]|uniref:Uncharacterized protein n=1 Tax=Giardia muris TaxID=5742 RepID=A0A4Z1T9Q0_GIAMU|nr:hypothetical protein GMRT_10312 [Giardia muris]|eukprot:TNJ29887.1 hypothetical protein GMRT_10312 [Giardia muris]
MLQAIREVKDEARLYMSLAYHYREITTHMTYECVFFMGLLFDTYLVIVETVEVRPTIIYYFPVHILIFNGFISFAVGLYNTFASILMLQAEGTEELVVSLRDLIIADTTLDHLKYPSLLTAGSLMWAFVMWRYLNLNVATSVCVAICITLCSYGGGAICAAIFTVRKIARHR